MLIKHCVDLLGLIEKMAYSLIMVKCIDNVRDVLTHINLGIPFSLKKLGCSVYKVGGEYLGKHSLLVSLIYSLITVTEKAEGRENKDSSCTLILKLLRNVKYRITG